MAVQGGTLRFLFENKGTLFHGRGFEMINALILHCCPDSVTNAFNSLLSIFNDVQVTPSLSLNIGPVLMASLLSSNVARWLSLRFCW